MEKTFAEQLRSDFLDQLKGPKSIDSFKEKYGEITQEFMWEKFMYPILDTNDISLKKELREHLNEFCKFLEKLKK